MHSQYFPTVQDIEGGGYATFVLGFRITTDSAEIVLDYSKTVVEEIEAHGNMTDVV